MRLHKNKWAEMDLLRKDRLSLMGMANETSLLSTRKFNNNNNNKNY